MAYLSLGKIFGGLLLVGALFVLFFPLLQYATGPNSALSNSINLEIANLSGTQWNGTAATNPGSGQLNKTFTLINNGALSSNGLGSNVAAAVGLGFVYPLIAGVTSDFENLGYTLSLALTVLLGTLSLGGTGVPVHVLLSLLLFYVTMRVVMIVISSWSKFDLWNG